MARPSPPNRWPPGFQARLEQGAPIVVPELAVSQADFGFETGGGGRLANVQPIARIVDPSVADEEDEPLFAPNHYDERRQKGGWLSLFGRPRPESGGRPAAMATRPTGGAQPAFDPVEDHEAEERRGSGNPLLPAPPGELNALRPSKAPSRQGPLGRNGDGTLA